MGQIADTGFRVPVPGFNELNRGQRLAAARKA